jgi:hypothetical protein
MAYLVTLPERLFECTNILPNSRVEAAMAEAAQHVR